MAADAEQQRTGELAGRTDAFPARLLVLDRLRRLTARSELLRHALPGPSDAEEFSKFGLGVGAEVVQLEQMFGLVRLQLRLLAAQPAGGWRPSSLAGPHPD